MKTGKWYFEFEALSGGDMRVGWARPGCRPDVELGTDDQAFVFDGYRVNQFQPVGPIYSRCWSCLVVLQLGAEADDFRLLSGSTDAHGKPLLWAPVEKGRRGRLHDQHGGQIHDFHPERGAADHQQGL